MSGLTVKDMIKFMDKVKAGTWYADHYYAECGPCKPWSVSTVKAMARRGYLVKKLHGSNTYEIRLPLEKA